MSLSNRLALLYAVLFFGPGVAMPFLPAFLTGRGLDAEALALALGTAQCARLFAGPMGGRLADRVGRRRPVIAAAALLAASGALLLLPGHGLGVFALALAVHGAGSAPLVPLVDTVALAAAQGARGIDFGRVRALGSVAFVLGNFVGAWALEMLGPASVPLLMAGSMVATALVAATLPEAEGTRVRTPGLALVLLRRPGFAVLIAASGLVQGSHAAFYTISTPHWQQAGITPATIAGLWGIGVSAEIALLFFARGLLRKVSPVRLAALAAAVAVLRWLGTAQTVAVAPLLALQTLHALTFAAMLLSAVSLVQRLVPPEAASTAQALQAALGPGLAMLLLTFACGPLYARFQGGVFLAMAIVAGLGFIMVLLLARRMPREGVG